MEHEQILDYIETQRVGVLAVEMMDGSPHAATVHFAFTEEPFEFFFATDKGYRKTEALVGREQSRASFVIGCDEGNMKTLQMDGTIELLTADEKEIFERVYLGKFPEKVEKLDLDDDENVLFKFTPNWWRFTDWTTSEGKQIITSD